MGWPGGGGGENKVALGWPGLLELEESGSTGWCLITCYLYEGSQGLCLWGRQGDLPSWKMAPVWEEVV